MVATIADKNCQETFLFLAILFGFINELFLVPEEWLSEKFLWDLQGESRDFSERFEELVRKMPDNK